MQVVVFLVPEETAQGCPVQRVVHPEVEEIIHDHAEQDLLLANLAKSKCLKKYFANFSQNALLKNKLVVSL